jgi:hypothetical protein
LQETASVCANNRRNDGGTIAAASFAAIQGMSVLKA